MARFLRFDDLFEGRHLDREIIIPCVRWYLRFKLSVQDLVDMVSGVSRRKSADCFTSA